MRCAEIGLLDATTYITALSGSTWAVAPWISTGLPLRKFKEYIQECASKSFRDFTHEEKNVVAEARRKKNLQAIHVHWSILMAIV